MASGDRRTSGRGSRHEHPRRRRSDRELTLALSIGGSVVALILLLVIVLGSRPSRRPRRKASTRTPVVHVKPAEPKGPDLPPLPPEERERILKPDRKEDDERVKGGVLLGQALRDHMNKAYQAALKRAEKYAQENRWNDALQAIRDVADHFDDHAILLQSQDDETQFRKRAEETYGAKKAEAERLAGAGQYDEARALLLQVAETFGIEGIVAEARERAQALFDRKWAEAAADYQRRMAPIEADILAWKLEAARDAAQNLRFPYEKYEKLRTARVERLQGLIAIKKQMILTVNRAVPRLEKRKLRAPGLEGVLLEAKPDGVVCRTEQGQEEFTWPQFGPEAALRLALLSGKEDDPTHRLWVARLLMEAGYLRRARAQLELAKRLGAQTAADEQELDARAGAAGRD